MAETARVRDYETKDVRPKWVVATAVGLIIVLVLVGLAIWGLLTALQGDLAVRRPALTSIERAELTPPAPHLQTDPQEEVAVQRRASAARLGSYGWIDRADERVHIPVEEAMKRLVDGGWSSTDPNRGVQP